MTLFPPESNAAAQPKTRFRLNEPSGNEHWFTAQISLVLTPPPEAHYQGVDLDKSSYLEVLHQAIGNVVKDQTSDANLSLSNFYYKRGYPGKKNYLIILRWTLEDEIFRSAEASVKGTISQCLYSLDTQIASEQDDIFIKRSGNRYSITKRSE